MGKTKALKHVPNFIWVGIAIVAILAFSAQAKDFRIYRQVVIEGVPYVAQSSKNTCGAATLAMLLSYVEGERVTEADILSTHPEIKEKGFYIPYLWEIVRARGYEEIHGEGDMDKLKRLILKGCPVIVYQYSWLHKGGEGKADLASDEGNENETPRGRPHFRLVIGFDEKRKVFITHDPSNELGPNYEIPFEEFARLWEIYWYQDEKAKKRRLYFAIIGRQ